ncbi:tetratricopeptide repeat protein [Heyndrickxia sporothermodurans]|uniref:tetratricopeptide repeat protein n=1 Tax=Heyndrickxia sporothermodurans TaxID=46224 RepID=UPI002E217C57|nr:tetratricopeptide repeat protein [Heyndrickxia sporothermodurans]
MKNNQQIIQFLEKGELERAKESISKVKSSGSHEYIFLLAEELLQLGFLNEAKDLYEYLLALYPNEGELKVTLAEILIEMDNEEEAISYLDSVNETDPDFPRSLLILADLYQMQGLTEVSEYKLLQAKEILPNEPIVDFALAELYASLGRNIEAIKFYEELIVSGNDTIVGVNVHSRIGEALSAAGKFEEALPYFEQGLEENNDINTLFGYAFTAYQAGFYKKGIELFNKLKAIDPEYHSLYLYLAKCYESEEELPNSLQAVKEGIAVDEYNKELFQFGGKLALKMGKEELAETYFRNALALDPGYIDAALTLNKLFLHQNRYEDVIDLTLQMDKEGDMDPQLHWDVAISFQNLEKFHDALNHYQQAYNDLKNNPEFLADYGYFLIEDGKRVEAISIFRSLVHEDPLNEEWTSLLERLENN